MENNAQANYKLSTLNAHTQKYIKVLIVSDIIFLVSILIITTVWNTSINKSLGIYLIALILAGFSGVIVIISTFYTFFKTIKKKAPILHAFNIFSRYVLLSFVISAILLYIANNTAHNTDHLNSNIINILSIASLLLINIAGFIHLAILNNKYKNPQQSPPNDMI